IQEIAGALRGLFPGLDPCMDTFKKDISVSIHGLETYAAATQLMRGLGIGVREKNVFPTFTLLTGEVDGVRIKCFPNELPPTCHREKYIERVPKTQTVDTGEFIEIEK